MAREHSRERRATLDRTNSTVLGSVTEQVDVLFNLAPISADDFAALVPLVRDGGIVVATTAWMATPGDDTRGVRTAGVFVEAKAGELAELDAQLLADSGVSHFESGWMPPSHSDISAGA